MAVFKLIIILIIGNFIKNVMVFNPMLTYTVRYRNISIHPINMGNFTIHQYGQTQYINGYMTIPAKTPTGKVIVIFYRCDLDGINCEYYQTWTVNDRDVCSKLSDKKQIWSSWYGAFHPPAVCPINKVHYQMINGTIDIGPLILLYPQATEYHWKVIQKYYGNDTSFICSVVIETSIFGYRKRTKSTPK